MRFDHQTTATRVLFGHGRANETIAEAHAIGVRPLVITDPLAALAVTDAFAALRAQSAAWIGEVRQHVPVEDAEDARAMARASGVDSIVAVGGGSVVGLAKAVALTEHLPIVAVPTTYAGSEMTPVWGLTEAGVKRTGRDPVVAPRTVIYDPDLQRSLPSTVTAVSGLNALAHCVDALWAPGRTPLTDATAERGIAALRDGLPGAVADGYDDEARAATLVGAWLAGVTFGVAGSSLHHKLCHILGGRFDLPHAETHAVVLPWVVDLAVRHVPEAGDAISRAFGGQPAGQALRDFASQLGAPVTLTELGLSLPDALQVADTIDTGNLGTPFAVSREALHALLQGATVGQL